jgi:hypothetical protein
MPPGGILAHLDDPLTNDSTRVTARGSEATPIRSPRQREQVLAPGRLFPMPWQSSD